MTKTKIRDSKKAMIEATLGKMIYVLLLLFIVLGIILLLKGKMGDIWQGIANILSFGGD